MERKPKGKRFCIYSHISCLGCTEQTDCIKRKSTEKDLKGHVDTIEFPELAAGPIEVVFGTDNTVTRKNPYGLYPCIFRNNFDSLLIKKVHWLDPKTFGPEYVGYLHVVEKESVKK